MTCCELSQPVVGKSQCKLEFSHGVTHLHTSCQRFEYLHPPSLVHWLPWHDGPTPITRTSTWDGLIPDVAPFGSTGSTCSSKRELRKTRQNFDCQRSEKDSCLQRSGGRLVRRMDGHELRCKQTANLGPLEKARLWVIRQMSVMDRPKQYYDC